MNGLKRLLWGVQNLASWVAEAKKVTTVAQEASNSGRIVRTTNTQQSETSRGKRSGDQAEIPLSSNAGKWHVGHQLRFFNQEADGSLSVKQPTWINLYYTEGRSFKFSGQVLLAEGPLDEDRPHGFAVYLREFDSLHRYEVTSLGIRIKHRLIEGKVTSQESVLAFKSEDLLPGNWHEFSFEVSENSILTRLGNQIRLVNGPLDTDGANKIMLCPGARLRDLRIILLD
jgi:hypothetical protein